MEQLKTLDVKEALDGQKGMSGFAWMMFIVSALLMFVDGYDNTTLSMCVTSMAADWGVEKGDFGWVMSFSNIGMIIGSFIFGWIGDKFGRKSAILSSLILFAVCTLFCAWCTNVIQITILRIIVTLGVGGLTPCVVAINNDYAPAGSKMKRVTTLFVGMNFGSALTGIIAAWLLPTFGWQSIMYVGALLPAIFAIFTVFFIPESVAWMMANRKPGDTEYNDKLNARIAKAIVQIRPDLKGKVTANTEFTYSAAAEVKEKAPVTDMFRGRLKFITPLLWINFLICLFVAFFFKSWMPTILTMKGMSVADASWQTSIMMFGSMAGSLTVGFVLDKIGLRKAAVFPLCVMATAICFGMVDPGAASLALIVILGFFQSYSYDINPAMTPLFYPVKLRSTASGVNMGVARIGSITAPTVGGIMIATEVAVPIMFDIVVLPYILSAIVIFTIMTLYIKYFKDKDLDEAIYGKKSAEETIAESVKAKAKEDLSGND